MQNTTIEDNVVLGQPAGDQAVAISLVETEIFASPQMRVWVWPEGPFVMSAPEVEVAEAVINSVARPVLRSIQDVRLSASASHWLTRVQLACAPGRQTV